MEIDETPKAKRPKKQINLLSRCSLATASTSASKSQHEDSESIKGHITSMENEMGKDKPPDTLLKPLMKLTYITRKDSILDNPTTVGAVIKTYPALKRSSVVGKAFDVF